MPSSWGAHWLSTTPSRIDPSAVVQRAPGREGWSLSHQVTGDGRFLVITSTDGATQHSRLHYRDLRDLEGPLVEVIGEPGATHRFVGSRGTIFLQPTGATTAAAASGRFKLCARYACSSSPSRK